MLTSLLRRSVQSSGTLLRGGSRALATSGSSRLAPDLRRVSPTQQKRTYYGVAPPPADFEHLGDLNTGVTNDKAGQVNAQLQDSGSVSGSDLESILGSNPTFGRGLAGEGRYHATDSSEAADQYAKLAALKGSGFQHGEGLSGSVLQGSLFVKPGYPVTNFAGLHQSLSGQPDVVGNASKVNIPGVGLAQPGSDVSVDYRTLGDNPNVHFQATGTREVPVSPQDASTLTNSRAGRLAQAATPRVKLPDEE